MQINEQGLRLADRCHIMSRHMYLLVDMYTISIWFNYDSLRAPTKCASNSPSNILFVTVYRIIEICY